jgi:hypothetical protein
MLERAIAHLREEKLERKNGCRGELNLIRRAVELPAHTVSEELDTGRGILPQ